MNESKQFKKETRVPGHTLCKVAINPGPRKVARENDIQLSLQEE